MPQHGGSATAQAVGHGGELAVGMPVVTRDGLRLGVVKEVRQGYFKVDVRLKPDYWLQTEFAHIDSVGQVVMSFGKDELGDYKVKEAPARVIDESMPMTAEAVRPADTAPPRAEDTPPGSSAGPRA
jgi:hypothetical protein